jgi:hypothetical protein
MKAIDSKPVIIEVALFGREKIPANFYLHNETCVPSDLLILGIFTVIPKKQ